MNTRYTTRFTHQSPSHTDRATDTARRAEQLQRLRERLQGADRHAVQAEIMPYEHLLPERFRGRNERIDERLP